MHIYSGPGIVLGPTNTVGESSPRRRPELLSGTGVTESHNTAPLLINSKAALLVGSVPIRFMLSGTAGGAGVVAVTDMWLAAGSFYVWTVDSLTKHVYVEAGDGAAAYEAWVWKAS